MTTNLPDLLTVLDEHTRRANHDPRDATSALARCSRLLTRLRDDGLSAGPSPQRDATTRRLADACHTAATSFEAGPGRLDDLIGAIADTTATLRYDLTCEDRWLLATRLARPAARCAEAIRVTGPYAEIPELLAVTDRAGELLHCATRQPAHIPAWTVFDVPIPATTIELTDSGLQRATDALAHIVGQFHRHGREPMSINQILIACHIAEHATHLAGACVAPEAIPRWESAATAWRGARLTLSHYIDHVRIDPRTHRVAPARPPAPAWTATTTAPAGRVATRHRELAPTATRCHAQLERLLPRLAQSCSHEVRRLRPHLLVAPGPRPLHENRTAEWLTRRTYLAMPPDLVPALDALRNAASPGTHSEIEPSADLLLRTRG